MAATEQPAELGAAPVPVPGARVALSPLLVLETPAPAPAAGAAGGDAPPLDKRALADGGSRSGSRLQAAPAGGNGGGAAAAAPPPAPGSLERFYWDWRLRYDLSQVDAAFLAFTASQALLMASRDGAAGRAAVALLLAACALQLGAMALAPRAYERSRMPLVCAVRLLHSAAGWLSQRALQARLGEGALAAAALSGPAAPRASAVQAVLACTGIGRLVLQPLGLQLPFRLALPLQLLDFAVARGLGADALRHVTRFLEGGRHLGTSLHLAHDTLDGLFHVSTALLFPGAYSITLSCSPAAVELLVVFLQLLCGCLLPLYCAYVSELSSKVRYVQQWAASEALGVRAADQLRPPRAARHSGASGGAGGAAADADGSGSGDGEGSISSHSGGSWPSSRSGGERGYVYLELRGPVQLLELESVSGGNAIAPHTHGAWVLVLVLLAWGVTSQLRVSGAPAPHAA